MARHIFPAGAARHLLAQALGRWQTWRAQRHAHAALLCLDEHALRDLGLNRGSIDYAVRHGRSERGD